MVFCREGSGKVIIPKQSEVPGIISHYYGKFKGENRVKLFNRIRQNYGGISSMRIQDWINDNHDHFKLKPVFLNKDMLKPISASAPMERLQIDLVDFSSRRSHYEGKTYSYVLAVLDVFSRFLFLSPLVKKEAIEVSARLHEIFSILGQPKCVQTDQGSEFKGEVNKAFAKLGIKKYESRPYRPQSQGKVERSHGTWKSKLRYDISQGEEGFEWAENIREYMHQYNTGVHQSLGRRSPFEVFFGRKPFQCLTLIGNDCNSSCPELTDGDCCGEEQIIDEHLEKCQSTREKAQKASKQAAEHMVLRSKREFPPSEYDINEEVIVKNIYSGKKIKATKIFSGIIKERRGDRYKIEYQKEDKMETGWFPVSQITAKTKNIENKKQLTAKRGKQNVSFQTNYHIQKPNISRTAKNTENETMEKSEKFSPYKLRKNRISSYADRDKQYNEDLLQAIQLSKLETGRHIDLTDLNSILGDRGLRTVQVEGDGNCFFRVIAHQIHGNSSLHQVVRARAVEQVVDNVQMFIEFIEKKKIDEFVDSLSTNREWADNLAVQAVSDAYGVSLEVINSNQRIYGTRIINPRGDNISNRQLVIAHIEQIHFMSTEIALPFETATWGGTFGQDFLTNTCPIDGPLSWLMLSLAYFPNLIDIIKEFELCQIIRVYELFKMGKNAEAKVHWLKTMAKIPLPDMDCHGSEAEQFFEPFSRTKLASQLSIKMSEEPLISRLEESRSTSGATAGMMSTLDLPPFVFIPKDYIKMNDEIPTMFVLKGTIFILLLITVCQRERKHFEAFFRFSSKFWVQYDGIEKKKEKIIGHPSLNFDDIGFIVYGRENILNGNDVYTNDVIESMETPNVDNENSSTKTEKSNASKWKKNALSKKLVPQKSNEVTENVEPVEVKNGNSSTKTGKANTNKRKKNTLSKKPVPQKSNEVIENVEQPIEVKNEKFSTKIGNTSKRKNIAPKKLAPKKSKTERKQQNNRNTVDVVSNLTDRRNVQLVRLPVLLKYIEYDRTKDFKHQNGTKYLKKLESDIQKNGLKEPLILSVSKETQRAYLSEGNHRIICLENLGVHWVPLKVGYWFLNNDNCSDFPLIPAALKEFPESITPGLCGFEVRDL